MNKRNRTTIVNRAKLQNASFQGANLQNADLQGNYLRYIDFLHANLRGANLRGADLWYADLRHADLRDANLRDANLRNANLQDANLLGADLKGANLLNADLRHATLRLANLRLANLQGTDLRYINDLQDAILYDTVLDPLITRRNRALQVRQKGLILYRQSDSPVIGGETYQVGRTYVAPVFSHCPITACHPGIYAGTKKTIEANGYSADLKVYVRAGEYVITNKGLVRCERIRILARDRLRDFPL